MHTLCKHGMYGADVYTARRLSMVMVLVVCLAALIWGTASAAASGTRTLRLYNMHTKESLTATFRRNGRYVPSELAKLNRFLRDWRRNEVIRMDPNLFDIVWEMYQKTGSRQPIHVVSGYRSPTTNRRLRKRSRGVAKHSQHTLGKAMDFFLPDVKLRVVRNIALRMGKGGIGYYPTSNRPFTHMDTGTVRHWPRMSRRQLLAVFPNGGTVHVPRTGGPLKGYKQAVAAMKARKARMRSQLASLGLRERGFTKSGKRISIASFKAATKKRATITRVARAPAKRPPVKSTGGSFISSLFSTTPPAAIGTPAQKPAQLPAPKPSRLAALPPKAPQNRPAPGEPKAPLLITNPPMPVVNPRRRQVAPAETQPETGVLLASIPTPPRKPAAIKALYQAPAQEKATQIATANQTGPGQINGQPTVLPDQEPGTTPQQVALAVPMPPDNPARKRLSPQPTASQAIASLTRPPEPRPSNTLQAAAYAPDSVPRPKPAPTAAQQQIAALQQGATGTTQRALLPSATLPNAQPRPRPDKQSRLAALPPKPAQQKTARQRPSRNNMFVQLTSKTPTSRIRARRNMAHPNQKNLTRLIAKPNLVVFNAFQPTRYGRLDNQFKGSAIAAIRTIQLGQ